MSPEIGWKIKMIACCLSFCQSRGRFRFTGKVDIPMPLYLKWKRLKLTFFCSVLLLFTTAVSARMADLKKTDLFARRGFSREWIGMNAEISETNGWKKIPAGPNRSLRLKDVFPAEAAGRFLSLAPYSREEFTYRFDFQIENGQPADGVIPALFLSGMGVNWEVYLNGRLLRDELHGENGAIQRSLRDVLIPVDPRFFQPGRNCLVFHISADPRYLNAGLWRPGDYVIDDLSLLSVKNSELITLILLSLYFSVGLFHIVMFFRQTGEPYNFYFASFAIVIALYLFARTHTVAHVLADSQIVQRIEFFSLFLLFPLGGSFLDSILSGRFSRFTRAIWVFNVSLALASLPAPLTFARDLITIWQFLSVIPILYYILSIAGSIRKEVQNLSLDLNGPRAFYIALVDSVPGNLLLGTVFLSLCAAFDIIDSVFFKNETLVTRYGFLFFVSSIVMILATRMLDARKRIELLNSSLRWNLDELNAANKDLRHSEEKYRLLVEGSHEIIFSLDMNWNFLTANKTIHRELGLHPDEIKGRNFMDLVYNEPEDMGVTRRLVREKLEEFTLSRKPAAFRVKFMPLLGSEASEFSVRLETVQFMGKTEILGKAISVTEDTLLKNFVGERQRYVIGNSLLTAEDLSLRLVRNLERYLDAGQVANIRIGLREMIINSIEHGNLDISFDEKTNELLHGNYKELIRRRRMDPLYRNRKVTIEYALNSKRAVYRIKDQGNGFDYSSIMYRNMDDINREMLSHGRGILMSRGVFDVVRYRGIGNDVTLVKYFS